ncbi:uncharacterized protein FOMMEDRAFT_31106 [Fomitiporia mediterranea MF3/22]|uniref:uncharacterized protein n=1 Tax=Fomitiporia mediterranea (strain MF3/22) TaxID=694068 RepID=UPI0004409748|nr:uncharacterized protein FOMMEDRAFT_31106 [Fomitiporia mediterranea MF3/22]EJC99870.1 hypothetical protein FOMMEDRAFT_31106 [Fomitiporia mediterranea MF3/22]
MSNDQLASLVTAVQHNRLATAYEYSINLQQEVDLIWCSEWSLTKILFIASRYGPFLDMPVVLWHHWAPPQNIEQCRFGFAYPGWMYLIGISATELVLLWRTWALWNKNRDMGIGLLLWAFITITPNLVVEGVFLSKIKYELITQPSNTCILTGVDSSLLSVTWILLLVLEAGSLYYVCLISLSLVNIIVVFTAPLGTRPSFHPSLQTVAKDASDWKE